MTSELYCHNQPALAWFLEPRNNVIVDPGTTRQTSLVENDHPTRLPSAENDLDELGPAIRRQAPPGDCDI